MRHVLADVGLGREATYAPVSLLARARLPRLIQQIRDPLIVQRSRAARTWFAAQAWQSFLDITSTPLAHRRLRYTKLPAHVAGAHSRGRHQNNPNALCERLRRASRARNLLKLGALFLRQIDGCICSYMHGHLRSSMYRNHARSMNWPSMLLMVLWGSVKPARFKVPKSSELNEANEEELRVK